MITRDKELQAKQEVGNTNENRLSKAPSSSRQWSTFRNPRIVRVSRAFGGKDRHSKVCTIRGLRDRRIRLSVPTAIQLYDLMEKLGLSQPSKVIDWLLDATKHDIDKLPPLPIMPYGLPPFHQQVISSHGHGFFDGNPSIMKDLVSNNEGIKINGNVGESQNHSSHLMSLSKYWDDQDAAQRTKQKGIEEESLSAANKGKWIKVISDENQVGMSSYNGQISAQNFFPVSHSSLPSLLNNNAAMPLPYNSYFHLEPPNLSLSQFPNQGILSHNENALSGNALALQSSSLSVPSGSQLFFCPSAATTPFFPYPLENNQRQIDHLQLLSSTSQSLPFSLNVSSGLFRSHNSNERNNPVNKDSTHDS